MLAVESTDKEAIKFVVALKKSEISQKFFQHEIANNDENIGIEAFETSSRQTNLNLISTSKAIPFNINLVNPVTGEIALHSACQIPSLSLISDLIDHSNVLHLNHQLKTPNQTVKRGYLSSLKTILRKEREQFRQIVYERSSNAAMAFASRVKSNVKDYQTELEDMQEHEPMAIDIKLKDQYQSPQIRTLSRMSLEGSRRTNITSQTLIDRPFNTQLDLKPPISNKLTISISKAPHMHSSTQLQSSRHSFRPSIRPMLRQSKPPLPVPVPSISLMFDPHLTTSDIPSAIQKIENKKRHLFDDSDFDTKQNTALTNKISLECAADKVGFVLQKISQKLLTWSKQVRT